MDVNSEQIFDGAFIVIEIQMYGVNANSIDGVLHIWFDGTTWHFDPISKCLTAAGPDPDAPAECFWATGNGNIADVTIWATNNGNYRTF